MKLKKAVLAALTVFVTVLALSAAEEKAAPPLPPVPRVVEALPSEPLPPRAADPSWLQYQEGLRLFERRQFDAALLSFKDAIQTRATLFDQVSKDVEAALATKEAKRAKGSISALADLLAARDLIPQDIEAIEARAKGSIVAELGLLRERSPSSPLRGLVDAVLLVVDERGLSRIGDSTDALRKAAADLRYYPEAEFGIGRIYLAEGEARLAELQLLRAYDMNGSLELVDDRYAMLESLADIYKSQGDLQDYEQRLREIADASDLFTTKDGFYRNAMERTLSQQGIDKFMTLYRVEASFATRAYSSLGALYLDAGRPLAVIYLAAAVNATLTRELDAIKVDEPNYAYKSLDDLAGKIVASKEMRAYAASSGLWRDLVLLGEALAQGGARDTARELWSAVVSATGRAGPRDQADPWRKRAAADFASSRNASGRP